MLGNYYRGDLEEIVNTRVHNLDCSILNVNKRNYDQTLGIGH